MDNFEWPYLRNGYLYSAHRAVIFAIAQLSCSNWIETIAAETTNSFFYNFIFLYGFWDIAGLNGKWLPDLIERLKASAWHQLYLPLLPFTILPMPDPSPSTLTVLNSNFLQLGRRSGGRHCLCNSWKFVCQSSQSNIK